ncbi:hypothetical protein [Chelatococcus reniformis]|uniref:Uncharacterized protein n=1 Tax=Chelatococcus reniformis TaxID=1494448 RepID=A0A916TZ66_9HYPH|nr:hypothetical protein [Chelatococcus reniformis]GGC53754.1 hypothetical protein GCM10010994_10940 [Chelatococcus reniformis]
MTAIDNQTLEEIANNITANSAHVFELVDEVTDNWNDFLSGVTEDVANIVDSVSDALPPVANTIPETVDSVPDLAGGISGPDGLMGGTLGGAFDGLENLLDSLGGQNNA